MVRQKHNPDAIVVCLPAQGDVILQATEDPAPSWLHAGHIPGLDGLRAIAVLLVVLAHLCQTKGFPEVHWLKRIAVQGAIGVDVFFVLSGFLITTLLFLEHRKTGGISLFAFYGRRAKRILPAYVVFLVSIAILQWSGSLRMPRGDWISALTYTVNFREAPDWNIGHMWSLSIEEHFYAIWPLALIVFGLSRSLVILAATIAASFLARWFILLYVPAYSAMAHLWTFTRIDTIAAGCLLAVLAQSGEWRTRLDSLVATRSRLAIIALVLGLSIVLSASGKFAVGFAPTLNAVTLALFVWATVFYSHKGALALLTSSAVLAIGALSYSLYLWQQPFLNPRSTAWYCVFPVNLALALIVASLSYLLIEKPFRQRFHASSKEPSGL